MIILKFIGRILLIPVWMILGLAWIIIHIIVEMFSVFHGLWKLVFGTAAVLSLCFGMWQNVIASILFIVATFLILLAGSFVEVLVSLIMECVGDRILGYKEMV